MHMKRRVPMPCNDSSNGSSSLIQFSISYKKKKKEKSGYESYKIL